MTEEQRQKLANEHTLSVIMRWSSVGYLVMSLFVDIDSHPGVKNLCLLLGLLLFFAAAAQHDYVNRLKRTIEREDEGVEQDKQNN